jgi:arylsulfatase A-like enzyme
MKFALLITLLLSPLSALHATDAPAQKPNIVLILADDLGYGDVSCYNPDAKFKTPHMDRLAMQGTRFTDAHTPTSVCTPTRYGILTGRHSWRTKLQRGVLLQYAEPLIVPERLTLPALLKQHGYHTACIGKWHLGWDWPKSSPKAVPDFTQPIPGGPTARGFDYYFGTDVPNLPPYGFIRNDRLVAQPTGMKKAGDVSDVGNRTTTGPAGPIVPGWRFDLILPSLVKESVDYIGQRAADKKPFFLYLPLTSPHFPVVPSGKFRGKSGVCDLADFIMETDDALGQVMAALDRHGLADNTILIFTSDNGPAKNSRTPLEDAGHNGSGPLRGKKASIYEGGHRVPFIARWPGHTPAGAVSGEIICQTTFLATCAELLGAKLPDNAAEDSYSILPLLRGGKPSQPTHPAVIHNPGARLFAIRQGPWKLIAMPDGKDELYDLAADLGETKNVIAEHRAKAGELTQLLQRCIAEGRSTPGPAQKNDVPVLLRDPKAPVNARSETTDWAVDFRFAPERWQTCIGLPDDPFKSIVGHDGGFYYDYSKAQGRRFGTQLHVELDTDAKAAPTQQHLHSPRVPVVTTRHKQGALELRQVAWANAPAGQTVDEWSAQRADFLSLTVANTGETASPARLRLKTGATVSLRLDDSRTRLVTENGQTFCWFSRPCQPAEAGPAPSAIRSLHPLAVTRNWSQPNKPCDACFKDVLVGHKSPLEFEFVAGKGRKHVVKLGLLEAFYSAPGKRPLEIQIEGKTVRSLDLVKEYGQNTPVLLEFPAEDTNGDGKLSIAIHSAPGAVDTNTILTSLRILSADGATLALVDADHLPSMPRPLTLTWDLGKLDPGRETELLVVVPQGAQAKRAAGPFDGKAESQRAIAFWEKAALPYGSIEVPDAGIQAVLDSCVRNIYQAREIKNGLPAFQVGPTIYRGLWVVDGAFLMEAVTMLGRVEEARNGLRYLLGFQRADGGIEIIERHWKETGIMLWAVTRHARLTGDPAWLREVWPKIERGVDYIRHMRQITDPQSPNYRLVPDGFSDGGVAGSYPEYTNIYWTLNGLRAACEAAAWLGKDEQARQWRREFDDFMAAFRKAAERDARLDEHGNRFVPVRMRDDQNLAPQRGQWAFLHAIFPGKLFAPDDKLMRGTLATLQANERQGLVYGASVPHAIWAYLGSFYAHGWLWLGDGAKAARTLYAFANHASPLMVWREEQVPLGEHDPRDFGDMPHNWASAEFIRLVRHLLVLERGDELHLLEGLPGAWLKPGAVTRLRGVLTEFGPLGLELRVAADGRSARLRMEPLRRNLPAAVHLHLGGSTVVVKNTTEPIDRTIPLVTP